MTQSEPTYKGFGIINLIRLMLDNKEDGAGYLFDEMPQMVDELEKLLKATQPTPVDADIQADLSNLEFLYNSWIEETLDAPAIDDEDTLSIMREYRESILTQAAALEVENKRLRDALRGLSFAAQTSGGTSGQDDGLMAAINVAEKALKGGCDE